MTGKSGHDDIESGERTGEVSEDRVLTLVAWVLTVVAEEAWNGGDSRRTAAAVPEKTKMTASIPSLRVRFLLAEGRG